MKVYNREDFLKLPEGVIFISGPQWALRHLRIKDKSIDRRVFQELCIGEPQYIDFFESCLESIEHMGSADWDNRMEDMIINDRSYPINKSGGRDGGFDDDEVFMVYEKEDLEYMISKFQQAMLINLP